VGEHLQHKRKKGKVKKTDLSYAGALTEAERWGEKSTKAGKSKGSRKAVGQDDDTTRRIRIKTKRV